MTALTDEPAAAAAAKPTSAAPGGGLGRYILVRFLLIFPTVLILVSLVFFLMRVVGDPITASVGGRLTEAQLADCGWVANRWCELIPVQLATKQQLMSLQSPLLRLELVTDLLDSPRPELDSS